MKKSKFKVLTAIAAIITMISSMFAFCGKSYAATADYDEVFKTTLALAQNIYEHSPQEWLRLYALSSTDEGRATGITTVRYHVDATKGYLVPVRTYNEDGSREFENDNADAYCDCIADGRDATSLLTLSELSTTTTSIEPEESEIHRELSSVRYSLIDGLKEREGLTLTPADLKIKLDIIVPDIPDHDITGGTVTAYSDRELTDADKQKLQAFEEIYTELGQKARKLKLTVTVPDGRAFALVTGNDHNFYLMDPNYVGFDTAISYSSTEEGKLESGTYYVPYTENDVNKKDLDVTAKITSKTDENIAYINDVALNADGTPNSEKWFYPDVNDKKVIARVYPFDEYDNTTYNGYVPRVQVKLTGDKNGVSYQTPSIEWTFRRKVITETENPDGSVTVVIEYNLPVDKSSIPSDWEPIYDEDGATIHKIKRTIKKGEDYDKDVTVKRNGSDDKVTTHVTKKWNLKKIPQAGEPAFVVAIGAIIVIAVVITRRKLSK